MATSIPATVIKSHLAAVALSFSSVILEVFVTIYFVAFGSIKTIEKMGKYEKASVETLNLAAQELHGMIA